MRRQDDGDAGLAQRPHRPPHVAPQLDIDARRGLVEEQNIRLVRQSLGDHHAALHPAAQRHDLAVSPIPQRHVAQHFLDVGRIGPPAKQAAAEPDGVPDRLEGVGGQFLRHQPDHGAGGAIVAHDVVPVGQHDALGRVDDAADDADERRLAGAVRTEKRKNLALPNLQIDVVESAEAGFVGFGEIRDGNDRSHRRHLVHGRGCSDCEGRESPAACCAMPYPRAGCIGSRRSRHQPATLTPACGKRGTQTQCRASTNLKGRALLPLAGEGGRRSRPDEGRRTVRCF